LTAQQRFSESVALAEIPNVARISINLANEGGSPSLYRSWSILMLGRCDMSLPERR
jgi:hypothetical protein